MAYNQENRHRNISTTQQHISFVSSFLHFTLQFGLHSVSWVTKWHSKEGKNRMWKKNLWLQVGLKGNLNKYKMHRGTFIHLLWSGDHIQTFWKEDHSVIQEIRGEQFTLTSSFYLLNLTPDSLFDAHAKSLVIVLLFLAKKCILLQWSALQVPKLTCGYYRQLPFFHWRNWLMISTMNWTHFRDSEHLHFCSTGALTHYWYLYVDGRWLYICMVLSCFLFFFPVPFLYIHCHCHYLTFLIYFTSFSYQFNFFILQWQLLAWGGIFLCCKFFLLLIMLC